MREYRNTIFISSLVLSITFFLSACGKLSNTIDVTFDRQSSQPAVTGNPFLGISAASNSQTSGQYKLEGSIGNQLPSLVKTSGAYKFYGGIQGEVVSR